MTTNQKAIRDLFKVGRDTTSGLPPMPAVAFLPVGFVYQMIFSQTSD
jgi:hypothetical protein